MIALNLFPKLGGTRFVELELNNLKQGIEFILFSLENLASADEGLCAAITERGNRLFPSIHFQQVHDFYLFQIYLENESIGEEGWYCLVDRQPEQSPEDLISTVWDEPSDGFFQARFSDGLMLSRELLVSRDALKNFLTQYTENLPEWFSQGKWASLGLI